MTQRNYTNLPPSALPSNQNIDSVVNTFNSYYDFPIQLDAATVNAMIGFFKNKGFEEVSAQSLSTIMISQAVRDNINPMTILDGLKGLNGIDLSELATQILNYNRFKSSYLGISANAKPFEQIQRNILA
jgi:hypothetical protein